ncbi:MAG: hypothetical protein GX552_16655 [Chloroflexi bacterium]|nr:hypothetical protein [Chloroflexota bacterium]
MSTREVPSRKGHWLTEFLLAVAGIFLGLLLVAGVAVIAYETRYADRMYEGVTIQGVPVGGLTKAEARTLVEQRLNGDGLPYVSLYTAEREWTVSTQSLGGRWELEDALDAAWRVGRTGVFRDDLLAHWRLLWQGSDFSATFHLEPGPSLIYLRHVARQAGHPAQQARLWVAGFQAHTDESEAGRELDIVATQQAIEARVQEALATLPRDTTPRLLRLWHNLPPAMEEHVLEPIRVPLTFREVAPPLTEVAGARERVETLLQSPLTLVATLEETGDDGVARQVTRRWNIDQAMLASWLTLHQVQREGATAVEVAVDDAKIAEYLQGVAGDIARGPREPTFDYNPATNTLKTLKPGQMGYALDIPAATRAVLDACLSDQREVTLPVNHVSPRVTRQDMEALMPLQLISVGESNFRGSTADRLHNIKRATAQFHGVTVPPQSVFSFVEHLGLVTIASGYSESWVIYGDRTELGAGGGVCQVSTTAFRAAFWGGYPIVERTPHAYRVGWYEPPVGLDAATFSPLVDFKFRNDTDTPILILTEVDEANAKLYFRFYGAPMDRKVRMEGPITENPTKPGEPVYEEDPFMAPGTQVQVEQPHDGLDVTIWRIIERDGQEVAREKFFTQFKAWPARYLVGPQPVEADSPPPDS